MKNITYIIVELFSDGHTSNKGFCSGATREEAYLNTKKALEAFRRLEKEFGGNSTFYMEELMDLTTYPIFVK